MTEIKCGKRRGRMRLAESKSHAHRILIAEFLSGRYDHLKTHHADCDDVAATKSCLLELAHGGTRLNSGESGTTRRLLGGVAAALGRKVEWQMRGKLAMRPQQDFENFASGIHSLPGNVSSQFVSALLFALPIMDGDSQIRLTTPLASRGYADMTIAVLMKYGICVEEREGGFFVPGNQRYVAPKRFPGIESDWSGAAFCFALKHLGNDVEICKNSLRHLKKRSLQPDKVVCDLLERLRGDGRVEMDVDGCPDLFPVLSVAAAARRGETVFTGTRRLRLKESDRTAAMSDVLSRFGVEAVASENEFVVRGDGSVFNGGEFSSFGDHRIAMSIMVGATLADGSVFIDDVECIKKSFPTFAFDFANLRLE